VVEIDNDASVQITELLISVIGGGTLAVDSVTIGGTSYLLYTYSKGSHLIFLCSTCLRNQVHVSASEKMDIFKKIEECVSIFKSPLNALSVDNGARLTMFSVAKQYSDEHPNAVPLLTNRDCAHCIDLVAKDSANAPAFSALLVDINLLIDLLNVDRVNGIQKEINRTGELKEWVIKTDKLSDTRFNKAGIMLMSVRVQRPLLELLSSGHPRFKEYYDS